MVLSIIQEHISDFLFTDLDSIFSELLQIYWLYTTNWLHCDSQDIHEFQDKLSVTPIQTMDASNNVMMHCSVIEVAKIIAQKPPFEPNPDFYGTLLVNYSKMADSVAVNLNH